MYNRGRRRAVCLSVLVALSGVALAKEPLSDKEKRAAGSIDEERSLVLRQGTLILEPSLQYLHGSSTEVSIEGLSVMPAVVIGLFDINKVQRDTLIAGLALRYGLAPRIESEIKVPYVWREQSVKERKILEGSSVDILQDSDGRGWGDVELSLRYQLNGGRDWAVFIGSFRVKTTTGRGPFDVRRRLLIDKNGNPIGEVFVEQPTGSGFWALQPALSVIYPSDPAVLYGSINYLWNMERDVGAPFGKVDPGDAFGINFGFGFAANSRTSFSFGYDHTVVLDSSIENDTRADPRFDRLHVGSLQFGFSHLLSPRRTLGIALRLGVTDEAPDVHLTVKVPISW